MNAKLPIIAQLRSRDYKRSNGGYKKVSLISYAIIVIGSSTVMIFGNYILSFLIAKVFYLGF